MSQRCLIAIAMLLRRELRVATLVCSIAMQCLAADAIGVGAQANTPKTNAAGGEIPSENFSRQLLADVQSQARSASAVVRAKVWLELAKQCARDGDKNKEKSFLADAFDAAQQIPPVHNNYHWVLQDETLRILLNDFGPANIEERLPRMDQNMRGMAIDMLLNRYVDDANWDKAIETVRRSPRDYWFPFMSAEKLMAKLPSQRAADRALIFGIAYRICDGKHVAVSSLTTMIEKYWRDLPREQVMDAIPRILKEALRTEAFPILRKSNAYDNAKPQLLAILKELDPAKAEQWERGEEAARQEARKAGPLTMIAGGDDSQSAASPAQPPQQAARTTRPSAKPRVVNQCLEDEPWCDENRVSHALEALMNHLKKGELDLAKLSVNRG